MAVTSYGRNKNHDDEIKKNQEKANNSPSYRSAAIKKDILKICNIANFKRASRFRSENVQNYFCLWSYLK